MGFILTLVYITVLFLTPTVLFPSLAAYRVQLWFGLVALACSLPVMVTDRHWRAPQLVFYAALLVCIPASLILGPAHYFGGALESFDRFVPNAIVLILIVVNCRSARRLKIILFMLVLVSGYFVFRGADAYSAQRAESPYVLTQHVGFQEKEILFRIRGLGVLNDPNDFAQFILVLFPFLWLGWRQGRRIRTLLFAAPITAYLGWGVFLTHSRGALVGTVVVLLVAFRRKLGTTRSAILTGCLILALFAANFAGGREVSMEGGADRFELWGSGLEMFKSSPLIGVGYGEFADRAGLTAHNSYVLCLAELGLVGYFCWLAPLVFTLCQLHELIGAKTVEADDGESMISPDLDRIKRLALIARLSLVGFLATSWFLSRAYSATCWLVLGIAMATVQMGRAPDAPSVTTRSPNLIRWSVVAVFASIALVYIMIRVSNLGL